MITKRTFLKLLPFTLLSSAWGKTTSKFELKRAHERHYINERWMNLHQSFHYFDYDNPEDMGYGVLRILDDAVMDHLIGTPVHPHKNMEILTIILEGRIFHQDTMGHAGIMQEGDIQLMSAGSGLKHAETNPSQFDKGKALQIWIEPKLKDTPPSYQQKTLDAECMLNRFELLVSPTGEDKSLSIKQDAKIYRGQFSKKQNLTIDLTMKNTGFYIFVIEGSATVGKTTLKTRDGLGINENRLLSLDVAEDSDVLVFEVALK